jgi:MFS family permease
MAVREPRKVIVACLSGTSLEWYDFFLYGTATALVFGPLFFPAADPLTGTLLAFATHGVGFIARPVGAAVFGHFGDRVGRKNVLAVTLLTMGMATFLIGLIPSYATIGVAAPITLVLLRFVQGFSLGGEWAGAVLMSIEHGSPRRSGLNGSWPQVGVPAGSLLAAGSLGAANLLLSDSAFLTWGWRVPFLLSGVLALVGLWLRTSVAESPVFVGIRARSRSPLVESVQTHPRALASAFTVRIGTDTVYYIFTLYIITYLTGSLDMARGTALNAALIGSAGQLLLIPLFGALSDRVGRRPVYLAGAVGAAVWGFVFFPLLDTRSFAAIALAAVVALLMHAAMWGPQAAFVAELFSTRLRYSGASLGTQAAGIAGGALAPIVAISLFRWFDSTIAISMYATVALGFSVLGLLIAPARQDLHLGQAAQPAPVPQRA